MDILTREMASMKSPDTWIKWKMNEVNFIRYDSAEDQKFIFFRNEWQDRYGANSAECECHIMHHMYKKSTMASRSILGLQVIVLIQGKRSL